MIFIRIITALSFIFRMGSIWSAAVSAALVRTNTMKSTSESLSPSKTRNGRAAEGNCVAVKRGGEQPEAEPWSQTQVNSIRLTTVASLPEKGEACRMSGNRPRQHPSSETKERTVVGAWSGNVGKVSWGNVETCADRTRGNSRRAGVRAFIVVMKRGNARGAKEGRKVKRRNP